MNERLIVKFVPKSQREKERDVREKEREEKRSKIAFDLQRIVEIENLSETCDILKHHHDLLIEDPNHLSTEFMLKLIKSKENQLDFKGFS